MMENHAIIYKKEKDLANMTGQTNTLNISNRY